MAKYSMLRVNSSTSSGNGTLDQLTIDAVLCTSFPTPLQGMGESQFTDGIPFCFKIKKTPRSWRLWQLAAHFVTSGMTRRGSDSSRYYAALVLPFALVFAAASAAGRAEAAGGAFVVDDVEIGKSGECKVESWASFASNRDFIGVISPACVIDIFRPVEIGAQFQRVRSDGGWSTSLTLKAKTSLISVEGNLFGLGLSGGASFDLTSHETSAYFFSVPLTFQLAQPLRINLNVGGLWDRIDDRQFVTWGAAFEYSLAKPFMLIGEVFGQGSQKPGTQIGLRYTPTEKIDFDLIYGRNLTGEHANWITLGVNLRR